MVLNLSDKDLRKQIHFADQQVKQRNRLPVEVSPPATGRSEELVIVSEICTAESLAPRAGAALAVHQLHLRTKCPSSPSFSGPLFKVKEGMQATEAAEGLPACVLDDPGVGVRLLTVCLADPRLEQVEMSRGTPPDLFWVYFLVNCCEK